MKPTSLSDEFYKRLYNEINSHVGESNEEEEQRYEIDIDGLFVSINVTFESILVDDSFDHAFGTEHAYHTELGEIQEIEIDVINDFDAEGNEIDITDEFDPDKFWAAA